MRFFITSILLLVSFSLAFAQPSMKGGISGKIFDESTKKPIEYGAIYLKHLSDSTFTTGGLTDEQGVFLIEGLKPGQYLLQVSFVGYKNLVDTIKLTPPNMALNLPSLYMSPTSTTIETVQVTAEREQFTLAADKKVFEVGKNSIAAGGNALDVLKQVPTLNVDIDNKISIRGSENVTIFINGKPSGLVGTTRESILQQLQASQIERIELITNPSAKYDAESTSGIINIITNQRASASSLWNISLSEGTMFDKHNGTVGYVFKKGKWSGNYGVNGAFRRVWGEGYNKRTNLLNGIENNQLNTNSNGYRENISTGLNTSTDWQISKSHSLNIALLGGYDVKNAPEDVRYFLDTFTLQRPRTYTRQERDTSNTWNVNGGLNYRWKKEGRYTPELVAVLNTTRSQNISDIDYRQVELGKADSLDIVAMNTRNWNNVVQLDYTKSMETDKEAWLQNTKIETGLKGVFWTLNDFQGWQNYKREQGRFVNNAGLTNAFDFTQNVYAAYGIFSGSVKDVFNFSAGLRLEHTTLNTYQAIGNISAEKQYFLPFPSVALSKKLKHRQDITLGYSRRINRPGPEQVNPFANYSDPLNIRIGNPQINPEVIDAFELNYQKQWEGHAIIGTLYYRQVNDAFQRTRTVDPVTGVARVTFINLFSSKNMGLELIARNKWTSWFNTVSNVTLFRNVLEGATDELGSLAATNFSYTARVQANLRPMKNMEIQATFNYTGPNRFPQSRWVPISALDMGVRWDILKGKGTLNLSVTDIFDTRYFGLIFDQPSNGFYGDFQRKRESRVATLTFSYRIGKTDDKDLQQAPKRRPGQDTEQRGGGDMGGGM